jgi:hypothetical protein
MTESERESESYTGSGAVEERVELINHYKTR